MDTEELYDMFKEWCFSAAFENGVKIVVQTGQRTTIIASVDGSRFVVGNHDPRRTEIVMSLMDVPGVKFTEWTFN